MRLCSIFLLAALLQVQGMPIADMQQHLSLRAELTVDDIIAMKNAVKAIIPSGTIKIPKDNAKADVAGGLLQLAFHDAGTYDKADGSGGPDGCIDLELEENKGLKNGAAKTLAPVYKQFEDKISYADFVVLAANAAIESTLPRDAVIDLPFNYGRIDGTDCSKVDHGRLPESSKSTEHVVEVFADRMGLSFRDITALMGGHSIGRASLDISGYEGPWDKTQSQFDNMYYDDMLFKPWDRMERKVKGKDMFNWIIPGETQGSSDFSQLLNTDVCLAFELRAEDEVNVNVEEEGCVIRQSKHINLGNDRACAPQTKMPTRKWVDIYAKDQGAWLADFAAAWGRMTELGWEGKLAKPAGDASKLIETPAPISAERAARQAEREAERQADKDFRDGENGVNTIKAALKSQLVEAQTALKAARKSKDEAAIAVAQKLVDELQAKYDAAAEAARQADLNKGCNTGNVAADTDCHNERAEDRHEGKERLSGGDN